MVLPDTGLIVLILLLGGVLRSTLLWQDLAWIDHQFLVDDTYLSLGIARNIALGFGSTFDRMVLTNGYQPLYVWLMVPVYWLFPADRTLPIHIALSLLTMCSMTTGWFLFRIMRRLATPWHGALACAFWLCDYNVVRHSLNGLETALAILGMVVTLNWYLSRIQQQSSVRLRDLVGLGLLSGLSILARVDQGFVLVSIAVDMMLRHRCRTTVWRIGIVVVTALALNLPWMLFGLSINAGPFPSSGSAVRYSATIQLDGSFRQATILLVLIMSLILSSTLSTYVLLIVGLLVVIAQRLRSQPLDWIQMGWKRTQPLRFLWIVVGLFVVAYWLYVPGYWYFDRYLHPLGLIAVLFTVSLVPHYQQRRRILQHTIMGVFLSIVALSGLNVVTPLFRPPPSDGYIPIARWVDTSLRGETVGVFQAGAVGYWADTVHVVNLDGVIDHHALAARQQGQLASYIRQRHVTWVVDWNNPAGARSDGDLSLLEPGQMIPQLTTLGKQWYLFRVTQRSVP